MTASAACEQDRIADAEIVQRIFDVRSDKEKLAQLLMEVQSMNGLSASERVRLSYRIGALLRPPLEQEQIALLENMTVAPLPEITECHAEFADNWARSINNLCYAFAATQQLDKVLPLVDSFNFEDRSIFERIWHARVLLDWKDELSDKRAAGELGNRVVGDLMRHLPNQPSLAEAEAFYVLTQTQADLDADLRLKSLSAVSQAMEQSIATETDWSSAVDATQLYEKLASRRARLLTSQKLLVEQEKALRRQTAHVLANVSQLVPDNLPERQAIIARLGERERAFGEYLDRLLDDPDLDHLDRAPSSLVGRQAPKLAGVVVRGTIPAFGSVKGKIVLLDFWGIWCAPCIRGFPKLAELHRKHADAGLEVVGVSDQSRYRWNKIEGRPVNAFDASLQEYAEAVDRFTKSHGLSATQIIDIDGTVADAYSVTEYPSYFLIDGSGKIVMQTHGDGFAELVGKIETLLER